MPTRHWFVKFVPFAFAGGVAACTGSGPDVSERATAETAAALRELPGFIHLAKHAVGDMRGARMERLGLAAVRIDNAEVTHVAAPNGWGTSLSKRPFSLDNPPFPGGVEDHNQAVRALFLAQGLPADQTGPTGGTPLVYSEADIEQSRTQTVPPQRVLGYTSTVSRKIEGISVIDSVAAATLDGAGEPISQSAYWPPLPRKVVDEAVALRDRLSDPKERAAYIAKLDIDMTGRDGKVVIRHSHAVDRTPFEAFAVFQASPPDGTTETERLYDARGQRVLLPLERPRDRTRDAQQERWADDSACALAGDFRLPMNEQVSIHVSESGRWAYARNEMRIEGRIERTEEGMAITDDGVSAATACAAGITGRYKVGFREGCQAVRFELIEDACQGRARTLDQLVLKRGEQAPPVLLGADGALER